MSKKKNSIVPLPDGSEKSINDILNGERQGIFKQGKDKLGRPYEKKMDDNGFYTKTETLKDGTPKITIKDLRKKKK